MLADGQKSVNKPLPLWLKALVCLNTWVGLKTFPRATDHQRSSNTVFCFSNGFGTIQATHYVATCPTAVTPPYTDAASRKVTCRGPTKPGRGYARG